MDLSVGPCLDGCPEPLPTHRCATNPNPVAILHQQPYCIGGRIASVAGLHRCAMGPSPLGIHGTELRVVDGCTCPCTTLRPSINPPGGSRPKGLAARRSSYGRYTYARHRNCPAEIVVAYIVTAYTVMAYIVMAAVETAGRSSYGLYSYCSCRNCLAEVPRVDSSPSGVHGN